MKNKTNFCPLLTTEKRLLDCLNLIVETKNKYFEPDAFRLSLNNSIQTLRTVTFVLQKNKTLLTDFDNWYGKWQENMKKDPILKWLIESRNTIVKKGDLATQSMARFSIVESWLGSPTFEMNVPPFTKTKELAKLLAQATPNKEVYVVGLLRLERRWTDSRLPDHELLESLAHAYEILNKLLLHAHEKIISSEYRSKCSWYTEVNSFQGKLPPCLLAQDWDRTVWIDIATGETLEPSDAKVELGLKERKEAARRYPNIKNHAKKIAMTKNLEDETAAVFEQAKTILKTDGHHVSMAIMGYPDGPKEIRQLVMRDRAEKHLVFLKLAADIKKTGANSITFISEFWKAPIKGTRLTRDAIENPKRKEGLQVIATDSTGKMLKYEVCFEKDKDGSIHLGEENTTPDGKFNILAPFLEVWKN